ncbi:hypothetical protein E4U54_007908 [Claviceps lovelessii]|nr:hypothetical protein E4U54_007908 [Claviceps lovelessii]
MKFSAALFSAAMAGSALAMPASCPRPVDPKPKTFDLVALRPSSPIQNFPVSATNKGLLLNVAHQNATCKGENNRATFRLDGSKLFLYSDGDKPQQMMVDRSGMGQGVMQYVDAGSSWSRNGESEGWSINASGNLEFGGNNFLACPGAIDGAWGIWANVVSRPGGIEGCLDFVAHVVPVDDPVSCRYSS